jgi:hypothetical protein
MGKKSWRKIVARMYDYFIIFIILFSFLSPIALVIAKAIRKGDPEIIQFLKIIGIAALILGVLWLVVWIARKVSLRAWVAYETYAPTVYRGGQQAFAILCGLALLGGGAYQVFNRSQLPTITFQQLRDLPALDAEGVAAAPKGTLLTVTGVLSGNKTISSEGFVTYKQDEWNVFPCNIADDPECTETDGIWGEVSQQVPGLVLVIPGGPVSTLPAEQVTFGGDLTESVEKGEFQSILLLAEYNGQRLPDGSFRHQGLKNGDLVTVVGRKADTGGIYPSHLIVGDHDQMVAYFRAISGAITWVRISGVILMILSPFATIFIWHELD